MPERRNDVLILTWHSRLWLWIIASHGRGRLCHIYIPSPAFACAMTLSMRAAVARLSKLAVWNDACLGVYAPKIAVIGGRHRGIGLLSQLISFTAEGWRQQLGMVHDGSTLWCNNACHSCT